MKQNPSTRRRAGRLCGAAIATGAVLLVMSGCSWGTISREEFEAEWGAGVGTEDLFEGNAAAGLVGVFGEKLGRRPVRATSLVIHPSYAILEAQDPKRTDNLDAYTYRGGAVASSRPVHTNSSFEGSLFTLDDVALDKLPAMIEQGKRVVSVGGAPPSHVVIRKDLGRANAGEVGICVFFSNERRSGMACFDARGALKSPADPVRR